MASDRRDFLKIAAAAGGALGLGLTPKVGEAAIPAVRSIRPSGSAPHPIRLLILGGTGFIGPYQVRYAQSRGHKVSIFNRGRTNPGMFDDDVERLVGDRNDDLESLRGREWDVVIDNATSRPDWTELSANFLKDSVGLYFYVSSRSAYADTSRVPMTSDAPVYTYETANVERGTAPQDLPYGLAKALSEQAAQAAFPGRCNVIRPGLIIGPDDPTDRFTYWPVRIHRGGEVLAPGDPTDPIQNIDVRDLTEWQIRMAENGTVGVFNGVGPRIPRPWAEMLYGIRAVTTAETLFTWVPYTFLQEVGIRPYSHMPAWMPPLPGREGFARFDLTPEVEAGLTFRSLADTTQATLDFHFSRNAERQATLRAGISAEREAEVLAAWKARQ